MTSCDPRRGIEGAYLGDVDDAIVVGEVRVRDVRLDPLLDLLDRGLTGTGIGGNGAVSGPSSRRGRIVEDGGKI